jgi:glycosyltransferase involved in cell wall biosynthesis
VADVEPYYDAFDVFLNTSIYEGMSIATLEAGQHGCPIVTADAGGQREVPGEKLVVEDSANPEAYVQAILRLLKKGKRSVAAPPPTATLVPTLWALLARHGVELQARPTNVKTLFVTSNLNAGGAQRSLTNLLTHLPGQSTAVAVLGHVTGEHFLAQLRAAEVPVLAISPASPLLERAERLLTVIDALGADTVCFWNAEAAVKLLVAKILAHRALRLIDVSPGPMLFQELGETEELQRRIVFSTQQYLDRLDAFVAKYEGGGPPPPLRLAPSKLHVIANGVPDCSSSHPASLLPEGWEPAFALVTCCRIVPNKRIEVLLEAMALLARRIPKATLTIVGGVDKRHAGYWESIEQRIADLGLTNVHFAGPRSDVESFLAGFSAFVMISNAQGCPNASLEAMRAGLPVIANADGGTGEQVIEGVSGFLVVDDPAEIAERAARVLEDPLLAARLGEAGRRLARDRFSMEAMVTKYRALLDSNTPPDHGMKKETPCTSSESPFHATATSQAC